MVDSDADGEEPPPCSRCGRPAPYRIGEGTRVVPVCERHLEERHSADIRREHPVVAWLEEHDDLWVPTFRAVSSTLSPLTSFVRRLYDAVAGPRPPARKHRDGWHDAREAYRAGRPHQVVEAAERALEPYVEVRLRREEYRNLHWLVERYLRAADALDYPVPRKFQYPVLAIASSELDYYGYTADTEDGWTAETLEAVLLPFYDQLRADILAYDKLYKQLETLRADHPAIRSTRRQLVDGFLDRPPLPKIADKARDLLAGRNRGQTIPLALIRYERHALARKRRYEEA